MGWLHVLVLAGTVAGYAPLPRACAAPSTFTYILQCPREPGKAHLSGHFNDNDSDLPTERWLTGRTCYGEGPGRYCTYTDTLFNGGEGISFITTSESISNIASRTLLHDHIEIPNTKVRYREVEIAGKGRGLVATELIRAGQTLISRTPALVLNADAVKELKKTEREKLLAQAVDNLPLHHRDEVLRLSTHDGASTEEEKAGKIFSTNSFATGAHDGKSKFQSLFTTVSRINHSCRPNCAYFFDTNTWTQNVAAARDIQPGEELSIGYIDPILTRAERLKKLKVWGFECSCERCSANATETAESDSKVLEIQRLWKIVDDYSASSHATPEMAGRLIALYEQEGLQSRIQEAHYRAALEWIGIGNVEKASESARLCVKYGTLFKGSGRPFIQKMMQLMENPAGHSHWMLRARKP
ncbi:hypothetical protein F4808DRAFT_277333 [Astrocystis sublimbata]|nr:hypothetical protein F4808DRAFT_277333 [Astrocystis sublimbata]